MFRDRARIARDRNPARRAPIPPGMTDEIRLRRSARRARRELRRLHDDPPPCVGLGPQGPQWYVRYTRRICRFLLDHLEEHELRDYEIPFTALHEMVACAWAARPRDANALREHEAWRDVAAAEHLAVACSITMLPAWVDPIALVPLMRRFARFLGEDGAMDPTDAERLDFEYAMFDPTEAPVAVA